MSELYLATFHLALALVVRVCMSTFAFLPPAFEGCFALPEEFPDFNGMAGAESFLLPAIGGLLIAALVIFAWLIFVAFESLGLHKAFFRLRSILLPELNRQEAV